MAHGAEQQRGDKAGQRAGGLVGQNDRRVAHQRPRDGYALLLAARKLVGLVFQLIAQPHLLLVIYFTVFYSC